MKPVAITTDRLEAGVLDSPLPVLGVLLPCHVVVRRDHERTVVATMGPLATMGLAANPALEPLAAAARERIERAVASR